MLKLTATRKSAETDELHYTEQGSSVAECGADNQRRTTKVERFERTRCFTCVSFKHLEEEV